MDDCKTTTTLYMSMPDTCPCCGFMTVSDEYGVCRLCRWEDDYVQRPHPDVTGANGPVTLRQAQQNYAEFGVKDPNRTYTAQPHSPQAGDERNPRWRPIESAT
jgi:hypothetical protein